MNKSLMFAATLLVSASSGLSSAVSAEALPRGTPALTITPAMIQEAAKVPHLFASTATVAREPDRLQEIAYEAPKNVDHIPNSCAHNPGALCFDYRTGSAVYKPIRSLLPAIPGMTPHNISLRRNRVVAQYTFK